MITKTRRWRTVLGWAASVLGALLALVCIALLAAPFYLNLPELRQDIERMLSRRLGIDVAFERIDVVLLPRPALTFERVRVMVPRTFRGSFESVSIAPQLAPLLRGQLYLSRIRAQGSEAVVRLPETLAPSAPNRLSLAEGKAIAQQVLASLAAAGPGLEMEAKVGTVTFTRRGTRIFAVHDAGATASVRPDALNLDLYGTTEHWGAFLLRGRFLVTEEAAEADDLTVQLGHSTLRGLSARLAWAAPQQVEVRGKQASFALDELYRRFSSLRVLRPLLGSVTGIGGEADVADLHASGSLARPGSWQWALRGNLRHVVLGAGRLPAPLTVDAGFSADQEGLRISGGSASLGRTTLSGLSLSLGWRRPYWLQVRSGRAVVSLDDVYRWRTQLAGLVPPDLRSLGGTLKADSFGMSGPLLRLADWKVIAAGSVEDVELELPQPPGRIVLHKGTFTADAATWTFSGVQMRMADTALTADVSLHRVAAGVDRATVLMSGSIGSETAAWLLSELSLPREIEVSAPVAVSGLRVDWQRPASFSVSGKARFSTGQSVDIDLTRTPELLQLNRLALTDPASNAVLSARVSGESTALSFSGRLTQETLAEIFASHAPGQGVLAGDLRVKFHAAANLDMEARGLLEVRDITVPWDRQPPLRIEDLSLQAEGRSATVQKASFRLGAARYEFAGSVSASGKSITVVGNASADHISVPELVGALSAPGPGQEGKRSEQGALKGFEVRGLVRVRTPDLAYAGRRFSDVRAQAAFGPGFLSLTFTRAEVCGLAVLGTTEYEQGRWKIDLSGSATGGRVDTLMACLAGERVKISGIYDLRADLRSSDRGSGLLPELEGRIEFNARDGTIYQYPLLAKIFSVLSVTEILRGRLPELGGNGFPFNTLTVTADIRKGSLIVDEALIDGKSLTVVADGSVDLPARKADLVVLVAPFSTVNWIIRHTPIIGHLLGGTLISIPVKVSGDPADPHVVVLSPTAVGSRIIRFLENIVKLPVEIISPLLPGHGAEEGQ